MRKRRDRNHFDRYVEEWKKETLFLSSMTQIMDCVPYKKIVRMGARAIPLIMERMERESFDSYHWFLPLDAITNKAVKIPRRYRGKIKEMNRLWYEWYENKQKN